MKRASEPKKIGKSEARPLRITHTFPEPREDDAERFIKLVRLMLAMGKEKK
jgi:hypothetical protein